MNNLCFQTDMTSSEVAAWVQAVGSLLALFVAFFVVWWQNHKQAQAKFREERIAELRDCAAARAAAFAACNSTLALKKQLVKPMYDRFKGDKAAHAAFLAARASGQRQGNAPYVFQVDGHTFPAPTIPIETLRDLVYNKLSIHARALALTGEVEAALNALTRALSQREELMSTFRVMSQSDLVHSYFGVPNPNGATDVRYANIVEITHDCCDDLAFFSHRLGVDLAEHSKALYDSMPRSLRKGIAEPKPAPDFSGPVKSGLIPPDSQYNQWLAGFVMMPSEKT
jgi:hypothetical protein